MPWLRPAARATGTGLVLALALGVLAAPAAGFGTDSLLGSREHEMITRAALACRGGEKPPDCFEPRSLSQIAGTRLRWGGVGAPDIPLPQEGPEAHCDEGDFLAPESGYPQSRRDADAALIRCRTFIAARLDDGIRAARGLLAGDGEGERIPGREVALGPGLPHCIFYPRSVVHGRAKCLVVEGFGRALHTAQDFYSHSNWADEADPADVRWVRNPPGLNRTDLPTLLDTRSATYDIPPDLTTGCFEKREKLGLPPSRCALRVRHKDIEKDNGVIDHRTGEASSPTTRRGRVGSNFQKAVTMAILETRRQWRDLRASLRDRYDDRRAELMICALTRDDPVEDCQRRVPRLIGLRLSEALTLARARGLRLGVRGRACPASAVRAVGGLRRIYGQSPRSGTLIAPRGAVLAGYCATRAAAPAPTPPAGRVVSFTIPQIVERFRSLGAPYEPFYIAASCDPATDPACQKSDPGSGIREGARAFCTRAGTTAPPSGANAGDRIGGAPTPYAGEAPDPGDIAPAASVAPEPHWIILAGQFAGLVGGQTAGIQLYTRINCLLPAPP